MGYPDLTGAPDPPPEPVPGDPQRSALARRGPATPRRAARPQGRPRRGGRSHAPAGPAGQAPPGQAGRVLQPGARPAGPPRRAAFQPVQPGTGTPAPYSPQQRPEDRVGDAAPDRAGLPGRRALAPRPEAQERRPVHHPPARGDHDPRRAGHGPRHPDGRAAARHGRGHRVRAGAAAPGLRRRRGPPRRRGDQARPGQVRGGRPGRDRAQDGRRHGQGPPGPRHQARRPPAQHAHDALPEAGEAGEEGPRDPRDLRAAGPPPRHEHDQVGAGGPRLRDPLPQDVRRDRAARRRAGPQARRVPGPRHRRGHGRPARGPDQGHRHRQTQALLQRLPEDDRPRP